MGDWCPTQVSILSGDSCLRSQLEGKSPPYESVLGEREGKGLSRPGGPLDRQALQAVL